MWRNCAVALALFVGVGCASTGGNGSWEEVKKDLRGDNMKMRSSLTPTGELQSDTKSKPSQ